MDAAIAPKSLQLGDKVFLLSGGVATVTGFARRDEKGRPAAWGPEAGEPAFYVLSAAEITACVPIARAHETLRPLVSQDLARQMLEVLRGDQVPVPDSSLSLLERGKQVVHAGEPLAH